MIIQTTNNGIRYYRHLKPQGKKQPENFWLQVSTYHKDTCCTGILEPYEIDIDTMQELFLFLQCEYGRCIGKLYYEPNDISKQAYQVGYVFEKQVKYQDCAETYVQETLIEVWVGSPDKGIHPFK